MSKVKVGNWQWEKERKDRIKEKINGLRVSNSEDPSSDHAWLGFLEASFVGVQVQILTQIRV